MQERSVARSAFSRGAVLLADLETHGDPAYTVRPHHARAKAINSARDRAKNIYQAAGYFGNDPVANSKLGFRKLIASAGEKQTTVYSGRAATRLLKLPQAVEWREVVLDADTLLPLSAITIDERSVEWVYESIEVPVAETVTVPQPPSNSDEHYVAMTRAEAGTAAQLSSEPPPAVGHVPFRSAFAYLGGQLKSPRYYFIWANGTSEVQLIVSAGSLPRGTATLEDLGGDAYVLNIQDRDTHTQIFATSRDLLAAAVALMRQDYVESVD